MEFAVLWDWLSALLRWAHVAAAMAWLGAAFYFLARGLKLRKTPDLPEGAAGGTWQFHGGGYIQIVKYANAPEHAPDGLGMFKWESYFTWLTGALLLAVVYYGGADITLVDQDKLPMSRGVAILVSVASLAVGWGLYDRICKALIRAPQLWQDVTFVALMILLSWGYAQIFTGRAAMLHLGAFLATLMTANVFFYVVPNGHRAMAALRAGGRPDPADRAVNGQRGRHIRYLYLPVIFLMISVHYPLAFGTAHAWILPALVLAIGVLLRNAFNRLHEGKRMPVWPWIASLAVVALIVWITGSARMVLPAPGDEASARLLDSPHFEAVEEVVLGRCSMCHAAEPGWPGMVAAPKLVSLEQPAEIAAYGREIYLQSGLSHAMPPGNVSYMSDDERALIVAWFRDAAAR